MVPFLAGAQTAADAGLHAEELVVAGFTPTSVQLVLARLGDEDVTDAWNGVVSSRAALAGAQTAAIEARLALRTDPSNETCVSEYNSAQSGVATARAALAQATADFEALLFDQVEGSLLTELTRIRQQRHATLPAAMLALDWADAEMASLASALIEERRCLRREEEIGDASETLLADARSDQAAVTATARLSAHLAGVTAALSGAE